MDPQRIAELLKPFLGNAQLSGSQVQQVSTYLDLLTKWNARTNLTSIREPEDIVTRHFGESFFAAKHLFGMDSHGTATDLGSGAGFPGLPFKVWCPSLQLQLIESNQKKAVFLKEIVRALHLPEVTVLSDRAEQLQLQSQLVSLRAVERFEMMLPIARRLLLREGRLALLIGGAQVDAAKSLLPDLLWEQPLPLPLSMSRVLLVGTPA
jgi:16S rRNA (guanine527-N7)-methyltransferase